MSKPFSTTGIKFVLKSLFLCETAEEEGKNGATVQEKGNDNKTPPRLFRVTHFFTCSGRETNSQNRTCIITYVTLCTYSGLKTRKS